MRFAIPESATWPHIFRWNVFKQFTYVPFKKKAEPSWSSFFQQLNLTASHPLAIFLSRPFSTPAIP